MSQPSKSSVSTSHARSDKGLFRRVMVTVENRLANLRRRCKLLATSALQQARVTELHLHRAGKRLIGGRTPHYSALMQSSADRTLRALGVMFFGALGCAKEHALMRLVDASAEAADAEAVAPGEDEPTDPRSSPG